MEKYDLIIVGAGPAGIFTAVELLRHGSKKKMLLVEKGKPVEKRHCPKAEVGHCVNCRATCAITTGFSGAGAFSDGKLSLSYEVGGDLPSLIGEEFAQELIDYTDKIYLEFGADPHVEGIYTGEEIKAVVELEEGYEAGDAMRDEIMAFARDQMAKQKWPHSIDFTDEMPRDPNGKLYKRKLKDPYWEGHEGRIV